MRGTRVSFELHLDVDVLFYSSFKPSVFCGQYVHIVVLKGMFFFPSNVSRQQSLNLRSWPSNMWRLHWTA